jgi:ribosomal protein S18 acetylase RimI-like enzyme
MEQLHDYLLVDRVAAAYQLGDLDPKYAEYCRWWGEFSDSGDLNAVLLLYTGLRMPAVLTLGHGPQVEELLAAIRTELPSRFYGHMTTEHLASLKSEYVAEQLVPMIRMGLHRDDFVRADMDLSQVAPLSHSDTADIIDLYQYYPGNFFEPYQLETGYYYGIREGEQLVSIAGIHVVSSANDVAAIGNIVTHPDHRSKGYSRQCTSYLLDKLFGLVSLTALNVQSENGAARSIYKRLGFSEHMDYLEGLIEHG